MSTVSLLRVVGHFEMRGNPHPVIPRNLHFRGEESSESGEGRSFAPEVARLRMTPLMQQQLKLTHYLAAQD